MAIATRFAEEDSIKEFVIKYLTVSISMLLTTEKPAEDNSAEGKKKKLQELSLRGKNAKAREKEKKKEELDNLNRTLKKTFIIELARKIQSLRNDEINAHLKGICLSTNKRNKELFDKLNIGILVLLKYWGDPKSLSMRYIQDEEDKEKKRKEEEERQVALQKEMEKKKQEEQQLALAEINSQLREGSTGLRRRKGGKSSSALVPYSLTPRDKIAKKAMLEIDKIKLSLKEKEEIKRNEDQQMHLKIERQKKALKKKLDKRMIEHGVNYRNEKDTIHNVVFAEGEVAYNAVFDSHTGIPQIDLVDLEDEEERDVQAVKIFMKKYSKLWRFLFSKYANMCFSSKPINNFDMYHDKAETMNMAEITKFLKDHGFTQKHITKEELPALIRLINLKKVKRFDLTALTYSGFLEFVMQAAHFIYSRKPYFMNNRPLVEQIKEFFAQMEKSAKERGESMVLFEDPDLTVMADPELLRALNKKLLENPEYPVPEGFKKVKEKTLTSSYQVPYFIKMSDSTKLALEVLDDLVFEKLQFHILEPMVKSKTITKIRPIIRKEFPSKKTAVPRYLDSLEGRVKPKELDKLEPTSYSKIKYFAQRKYNLTENMRLEIVKQPIVKRAQMQECAEVLCELLDAAEKGLTVLPPRNKYGPGGLKNKGILMREHLMEQEMKHEKAREAKLKKISKKYKEQVVKKEEERKQELEATKDQRKAQRQKEREAKKKKYEQLVQRNEERIKEKQQRLEEIANEMRQKAKEEKEATKEQREKWKEEHNEFLEKQKEKIEKELQIMSKEREELDKMKKEYEQKEKETVEKIKSQVVKYFEENKDKLNADKKEKEAVTKFIEKPAVKAVFDKYDVPLKYFFDFYSRSEHHGIEFDLDKQMETMNYKEFIRFGYQSNIVPTLIPIEEMNRTFKLLVRERQQESNDIKLQVLDYKYFIKSLVRIAAIAQDYLGGQKGTRLEKRMEEINKQKEKTAAFK